MLAYVTTLLELKYRFRSNNEIEEYTDIHSDLEKQRIEFYRNIKRMELSRLTKQTIVFKYR